MSDPKRAAAGSGTILARDAIGLLPRRLSDQLLKPRPVPIPKQSLQAKRDRNLDPLTNSSLVRGVGIAPPGRLAARLPKPGVLPVRAISERVCPISSRCAAMMRLHWRLLSSTAGVARRKDLRVPQRWPREWSCGQYRSDLRSFLNPATRGVWSAKGLVRQAIGGGTFEATRESLGRRLSPARWWRARVPSNQCTISSTAPAGAPWKHHAFLGARSQRHPAGRWRPPSAD